MYKHMKTRQPITHQDLVRSLPASCPVSVRYDNKYEGWRLMFKCLFSVSCCCDCCCCCCCCLSGCFVSWMLALSSSSSQQWRFCCDQLTRLRLSDSCLDTNINKRVKTPVKGQFWLFLRLNLVKMFLPVLHLNNVNDGKDSESSFKHQYVVTYLHHISSKLCRITEENKHPKKRGISQFYIFIPRRRRSVEGVRVRPDGLTGSVCGSYRRLLVSVSVCRNSHLQSINQSINTWPVSPSGFS